MVIGPEVEPFDDDSSSPSVLAPLANAAAIGVFWFLFKVSAIVYMMIWFRGTFPRFRYDQLMNIGWKVMIPVGMAAIVINALLGMA